MPDGEPNLDPDDFARREAEPFELYEDDAPPLSLRDRFAMAALTGLIAGRVRNTADQLAAQAYQLADAMLLARGPGGR